MTTEAATAGLLDHRSPYRRGRTVGAAGTPSIESWVVHTVAWVLVTCWLVVELVREPTDGAVAATLLVGSTFLLVAPVMVVRWERKTDELGRQFLDDRAIDEETWRRLRVALGRLDRVRFVIVMTPVVLISVAYLTGNSFFADRLSLPESGIPYVVGLLVLCLGGFAAGWGVHGAIVTIVVAVTSTKHRADFAPFAGTPSHASRSLGEYCFSTAWMYGATGGLLIPGLCAAVWVADGLTRVALVGAVAMVLLVTIALLAVPAVVLSQRSQRDRAAFLDRLSDQIDDLGRAAADPTSSFGETQYVRLRALLEMRTHVVTHAIEDSAVEMVKRIPLAVLIPVASVTASWWSLVAS